MEAQREREAQARARQAAQKRQAAAEHRALTKRVEALVKRAMSTSDTVVTIHESSGVPDQWVPGRSVGRAPARFLVIDQKESRRR